MITRADTKGIQSIHERWIEDEKRAKKKDLIHKVVIAMLTFIGIIGIVTFTPNPFAFEQQSIDVSLDYQANEQHTNERSALMEQKKTESELMKQAYDIGTRGADEKEWSEFEKVFEDDVELEMKLTTEAHMGTAMLDGMSYGAERKDEFVAALFEQGTKIEEERFWTKSEDQRMRERLEKEYQNGVDITQMGESAYEMGKDGREFESMQAIYEEYSGNNFLKVTIMAYYLNGKAFYYGKSGHYKRAEAVEELMRRAKDWNIYHYDLEKTGMLEYQFEKEYDQGKASQ